MLRVVLQFKLMLFHWNLRSVFAMKQEVRMVISEIEFKYRENEQKSQF